MNLNFVKRASGAGKLLAAGRRVIQFCREAASNALLLSPSATEPVADGRHPRGECTLFASATQDADGAFDLSIDRVR